MLYDSPIHLDPADWCWATWRKRPHLPRPESQLFDLDQAIDKLKKANRTKSGSWRWTSCEIPVSMSIEEVKFWYQAITRSTEFPNVKSLVKFCQTEPLPDQLDFIQIQNWFNETPGYAMPARLIGVLRNLLPLPQLLDLILAEKGGYERFWLIRDFQKFVLVYLSDSEIEELRSHIRATWDPAMIPRRVRILGLLGLYPELESLVESWVFEKTAYNCTRWENRFPAIFGLANSGLVVHHMQRLKLKLFEADQVRAWLAHTELDQLGFIADSIAAINNNKEAQNAVEMFNVLGRVRSPKVVPHILSLTQRSRASHLAQQWLENHPELAIEGLLPLTIQKHSFTETAIAWLRMMQRQGFGELIREKMGKEYEQIELLIFDAPQLEELSDTPGWLKSIAEFAQGYEPLDWVKVSDLPAIVIGETQLSETQHQAVLNLLRTNPEQLSILKKHATADSLNQFVWQLYERWSLKRPIEQSLWVILALGRLGNDEIVPKLANLIREWCKRSKHQFVTPGMTALTLLASDTAVFELIRFAYQPISRLIQPDQALDELAKARNLSRRRLEDLAVLNFLEQHSAKISTSESRRKRSKMSQFTTLGKTELKQFLKLQSLRFEQQMVHEATYTLEEFQEIAFHPVLLSVTQSLIWQGRDSLTAQPICFRITEDGSVADSTDSLLTLSQFDRISLPHPLAVPDSSSWAELLSDYELIPPFPQINRPRYSVSTEEQDATIVTRFVDRGVFTVNLTQSLMKLGWTETYIGRGRWRGFYKPFPSGRTVAILSCTELPREYSYYHIDRVFFVSDTWDRRHIPTDDDRKLLNTVYPPVFSEVLRELDHLTHRSKKRHA